MKYLQKVRTWNKLEKRHKAKLKGFTLYNFASIVKENLETFINNQSQCL